MDGVSCLEAHNAFPALLGEESSEFCRLVVVAGEGPGVGFVHEQRHLATQEHISLPMEVGDAGMVLVGGAVDLAGLALPVVCVAILDQHGGDHLSVSSSSEGYLLALAYRVRLFLPHRERDRHAPDQAVRE